MGSLTARQRLDLLVERLQTGLPDIPPGMPWLWPEGDPVWMFPEKHPRWLPEGVWR